MENHRLRRTRIHDFVPHFLGDHFFVPLIPAFLSVIALPWASDWSRMLLSTNGTVDQVSQNAIASMEVVRLERIMGTICKLPLQEFAVKTASPLLVVSLLLFCFFCILQVYCRHCAQVCCDAYCNHLCHKFDWLCTD